MRRILLLTALFAIYNSILCANFSEEFPNRSETKVYVEPKDITLNYDGIYWDFEGQRIPVKSIEADEIGLFVNMNKDDYTKYNSYKCPGCGKNYPWYANCNTKGCPYNKSKPG